MTTDTITADPLIHQHVFLGQGHEQSERKTWAVISFAVRADFSRTATDGRDDVGIIAPIRCVGRQAGARPGPILFVNTKSEKAVSGSDQSPRGA